MGGSDPSRRGGAELLVLALTLALCTAAAEASLRLFLPLAGLDEGPPPAEATRLRYEGSIFSRHVLAAAPLWVNYGEVRHRINALGYRGPDFEADKPPGTARIVVYGGSSVFDIYAEEGRTWPARLEAALSGAGAGRVEVINAGIPGHASFDSLGRLFAEGHRFEPDWVVLYNAWNDIKTFGSATTLLRSFGPYVPESDVLRRPQGRLDAMLARHSQLYRRLRLQYLLWDRDVGLEGAVARPGQSGRLVPAALEQYELAVRQFVDLAHDIGAEPVLLTQLRLAVAGSPAADRERIRYEYVGFDHETLVRAFEATDAILARVSREEGALLVDASSALSGRSELFADHVHLSAAGSAALAEHLARALAPRLRERVRSRR